MVWNCLEIVNYTKMVKKNIKLLELLSKYE